MDFLSKISKFDKVKGTIELDLSFFDDDLFEYIEKCYEDKSVIKSSLKKTKSSVDSRTVRQHRKWFCCVGAILDFYAKRDGTIFDAQNRRALHEELKKSIFPVRKIKIGDLQIDSVPSINDLTVDELSKALATLLERYMAIGVDFEQYSK
jgi:hypothetical protein